MQPRPVQRILGLLLMVFSLVMLPPLGIALWLGDGAAGAFGISLLLTLVAGLAVWLPVARSARELRLRDGFMVVVLFWVVLGLVGALPFVFAEHPSMSVADAVFESVSGLTTTGATVVVGLDYLPPSILLYRQLLQWLGGMGIIVLAVAILPLLGIGGMQLYRAETPGPMKDRKLTPRIAETAKNLWFLYLGLTVLCALAYWVAGMSAFDAIGHSFATVAIGGYSTHDASLGFFDSALIETIAIVFMGVSGVNFALHYVAAAQVLRVLRPDAVTSLLSALRRAVLGYFDDEELRTYAGWLGFLALLTTVVLYLTDTYDDALTALRHGLFHAVSIGTTTGFTTTGFYLWPTFLPVLLLFASFVGGCAGSTGGGIKVIRVLLLIKQGNREMVRLVHPNAHVPIKVGGVPMPARVVDAVWSYFAAYVALFSIMLLALMATGLDQVTAFSAVAACLNNLGPGLGEVSAHYGDISDTAKWILCAAMLFGRLEIFTMLVLLSPAYWRD